MSSINEVSMANQASSSSTKKSNLTNATKRELESLGIDVDSVTSEAQAKQLIELKKAEKSQEESGTESKNQNSSEREIMSQLKELAAKVGVSVSDDDSIEDVLCDLSSAVTEKMSEARMSKDESAIEEAEGLQNQLSFIKTQYDNTQNMQSMLSASMNMLCEVNKMTLGL